MTRNSFCSRLLVSFGLAGLVFVAGGCGKDSPSDSGETPTTPTPSNPSGITVTVDSLNNQQTAPAGTAITVTASAVNADKSPVVGQTMRWTVNAGGGSLSDSVTTTDAKGVAKVRWTLGTSAGTNTATASLSGSIFVVTATGVAGPFAKVAKVSPDTQRVVSSASVSLVVRTVDQFGNAVPNLPVTWTTSGGALAPTSTVSGPSGNATVTFTTDAKPATYTITARTPGGANVTLIVVGL